MGRRQVALGNFCECAEKCVQLQHDIIIIIICNVALTHTRAGRNLNLPHATQGHKKLQQLLWQTETDIRFYARLCM